MPTPGPVIPVVAPSVATQNNTQSLPPATGPVPWLSEGAQAQASISAATAEGSPPPAENSDNDIDIGASDGSTGETELLTAALSDFSLHTDEDVARTSSISNIEKKCINDAMSRADMQRQSCPALSPDQCGSLCSSGYG